MKVRVKGLENLVKKLRTLPDEIKADVKNDIRDAADSIVIEAGESAKFQNIIDTGTLRNSINSYKKNDGLNYVIRVGANYAPYVEFGTGTEVQVPTELTAYAEQFRGAGKRNINIPARPFFFPAYFKHREELIKTLKQTLKDNLK